MLAVALVLLWCAVACAGALVVGRSVAVADDEARAAATAATREATRKAAVGAGGAGGAASEER